MEVEEVVAILKVFPLPVVHLLPFELVFLVVFVDEFVFSSTKFSIPAVQFAIGIVIITIVRGLDELFDDFRRARRARGRPRSGAARVQRRSPAPPVAR